MKPQTKTGHNWFPENVKVGQSHANTYAAFLNPQVLMTFKYINYIKLNLRMSKVVLPYPRTLCMVRLSTGTVLSTKILSPES